MDATWRENNIDIEKIQSFVTTRLNKSRGPNLLFNQLCDSYMIMQHKILKCYIFDDFDTLYVEADDGKGVLNVIFNSLLTTKLKYRMSMRKIEIEKTTNANLHVQFFISKSEITEIKLIEVKINP